MKIYPNLNEKQLEVLKNLKGLEKYGILTKLGICEDYYKDTYDYKNDGEDISLWVDYFEKHLGIFEFCSGCLCTIPKCLQDKIKPIVTPLLENNNLPNYKIFMGNYTPDYNPLTDEEYADMEEVLYFFTYKATEEDIKSYYINYRTISRAKDKLLQYAGLEFVKKLINQATLELLVPSYSYTHAAIIKLFNECITAEEYQQIKSIQEENSFSIDTMPKSISNEDKVFLGDMVLLTRYGQKKKVNDAIIKIAKSNYTLDKNNVATTIGKSSPVPKSLVKSKEEIVQAYLNTKKEKSKEVNVSNSGFDVPTWKFEK